MKPDHGPPDVPARIAQAGGVLLRRDDKLYRSAQNHVEAHEYLWLCALPSPALTAFSDWCRTHDVVVWRVMPCAGENRGVALVNADAQYARRLGRGKMHDDVAARLSAVNDSGPMHIVIIGWLEV